MRGSKRGNKLHLNFAHIPGKCGLAVSPDGRFALSSGVDCNIRLHDIRVGPPDPWWISAPADEPELPDLDAADLHDKPINAVALAPDSRTFATACDDGFVRLFSLSVEALDGDAKCASTSPSATTLSATSGLIQACARFGGPVRAIDFSPTGAFVAAAGDEPGVLKIVMTAQPSNVNILRACAPGPGMSPIVAVAFDPKTDFVATIGQDGAACVWNVESGVCVTCVSLNNRFARCLTWSPRGDFLAVGTDNGCVLISRREWTFDMLLEDEHEIDDDEDDGLDRVLSRFAKTSKGSSAVAWSNNGQYVLVGRDDATVRLWDVKSRKIYGCWNGDEPIQAIKWHPISNAFMVLDRIGQWGIAAEVVPAHMPHPYESNSAIDLPKIPGISPRRPFAEKKGEDAHNDDLSGSENMDEIRRRRKVRGKARSSTASSARDSSDDDEDERGSTIGSSENDARVPSGPVDFDVDGLDADDEEDALELRRHRELAIKLSNARLERERASRLDDSDRELGGYLGERDQHRERRRRHRLDKMSAKDILALMPRPQAPFMPSATPLEAKDARDKRILCWNLTAAVISYDENTHDTVEIEFADANRRNVGVKDHFGFTMSCLSEDGVLLASPARKEHAGLISFRPFASWSTNSEWTQLLGSDESPVAISVGRRHAAVAVSGRLNLIRLFSLSGIQTDVFGIPGPIVTLASGGDFLAVVYGVSCHSSELRFFVWKVAPSGELKHALVSDTIVTAQNSSLEWFGFTNDTFDLVAYDSSGCIWLNTVKYGVSRWVLMLANAAKTADCEWFWLAAVTSETAIGVPCLSNERYPPANPRPALRTVSLLAPVLDQITKSGKTSISERYFRTRLRLARVLASRAEAEQVYDSDDERLIEAEDAANLQEKETDKCLLGLMELACRQEHNLRAFDYATRLKCPVSFKFAVGLANHYKRTTLAGRVESLAQQRLASVAQTSSHLGSSRNKMISSVSAGHANHDEDREDSDVDQCASSDAARRREFSRTDVIIGGGAHSKQKYQTRISASNISSSKEVCSVLDGLSDDDEEECSREQLKGCRRNDIDLKDDVSGVAESADNPMPSQASMTVIRDDFSASAHGKRSAGLLSNRFQKRVRHA